MIAILACAIIISGIVYILRSNHHLSSSYIRGRYIRRSYEEIAKAIEAYRADYHTYPAMRPLTAFPIPLKYISDYHGENVFTIEPGNLAAGLAGITPPWPI